MAFTQITVEAEWDVPGGGIASGVVTFLLSDEMTDTTNNKTVSPTLRTAVLSATGTISITLTATNDSTTTPLTATYLVTEVITGMPRLEYSITLSNSPTTQNLADLRAAAVNPGVGAPTTILIDALGGGPTKTAAQNDTALRTAISLATSALSAGVGPTIIQYGPGTYTHLSYSSLASDIPCLTGAMTLAGAGMDATTFKLDATSAIALGTNATMRGLLYTGIGTTIRDITFDGNRSNITNTGDCRTVLVRGKASTSKSLLTVLRCRFKSAYGTTLEGHGLDISDTQGAHISECEFTDNIGSGLSLGGSVEIPGTNATVRDCRMFSNTWNGLTIYHRTRTSVVGCQMYGNGTVANTSRGNGINCELADNVLIDSCHVYGNRNGGIQGLGSSDNVRVTNSQIEDNANTTTWTTPSPGGGEITFASVLDGNDANRAMPQQWSFVNCKVQPPSGGQHFSQALHGTNASFVGSSLPSVSVDASCHDTLQTFTAGTTSGAFQRPPWYWNYMQDGTANRQAMALKINGLPTLRAFDVLDMTAWTTTGGGTTLTAGTNSDGFRGGASGSNSMTFLGTAQNDRARIGLRDIGVGSQRGRFALIGRVKAKAPSAGDTDANYKAFTIGFDTAAGTTFAGMPFRYRPTVTDTSIWHEFVAFSDTMSGTTNGIKVLLNNTPTSGNCSIEIDYLMLVLVEGWGDVGVNSVQCDEVTFTETSGAGVYTGTITLPAGATILDIVVHQVALWNNAGTITMDVGDTGDAEGYYKDVNLKSGGDLAAFEDLSFNAPAGKQGAYLHIDGATDVKLAQHKRQYSATAKAISGVITTSSTGGSTGNTRMTVWWALPQSTAATKV